MGILQAFRRPASIDAVVDDFADNPAVRELAHPQPYERARTYDPRTGRVRDIGGRAERTPNGYMVELDGRKLDEAYDAGAQYNYHYHPGDTPRIERQLKRQFRPLFDAQNRRGKKELMRRITAAAQELDRFGRHTPSPQDIQAMVIQESAHWSKHDEGEPRYGIVTNDPETTRVIEYGPTRDLRTTIATMTKHGDEQGLRHLGHEVARDYALLLLEYVEGAKAAGAVPTPEAFRDVVNGYQPLRIRPQRRSLEERARGAQASYTRPSQLAA